MLSESGLEMKTTKKTAAIHITNAFKAFSSDCMVLNGLNMNVPSGSIYGLLGSSGCGKTTLLNVVLGKLSLDSGSIYIGTDSVSDIGYMPQDLCLDKLLTIRETLEYYGRLYLMNDECIKENTERLSRWLKLPPINCILNNLSGGQVRRVSLAVALIHDPKILILDEPTVGIDPILRHEIWQELLRIVNEKEKTIIITTHYIEEAHLAHTIGLMRNGVIIRENSPNNLLASQNANSLEEAFLSLSTSQDKIIQCGQSHNFDTKNSKKCTAFYKSVNNLSLKRISSLLKKNFIICTRDYQFVFFIILFPVLVSFVYNMAIGRNFENVKLLYHNNEIRHCKNFSYGGESIKIKNENYNSVKLSCKIIDKLRSLSYNMVHVNSQEAGDLEVKKAKAFAFIQFPDNYTIALRNYTSQSSLLYAKKYSSSSFAYVHIDSANVLIKNQILHDLNIAFVDIIKVDLENLGSGKVNLDFFKINYVQGKEVKSYIHCIATMFVTMIGFYFSSIISTGIMLNEKMEGYLDRAITAGVKITEVMISIASIQTVIHVFHMICIMIITYMIFDNPIKITNGLYVFGIVSILTGWLGLLTGFLIAGLSKSSTEALNIIISWNMIQIYVSGVSWPLEAQPTIMKAISEHLPLCYLSRFMNNIALKGWTLDNMAMWTGSGMTIFYIFLHFLFLYYLSSVKQEAWLLKK
ncbi:ABC transporter G family member 23-like [Daktulosphaira vitifoliae]|uniref:ABC transporter G family member 23-like n=1 Tax=Daktulosphaira vitifoliae TaxID=58002 RepID=UPI0021A9F81B|nr:ABC transporter G family member 23-like [Daktulosphaira vitifoliae]